jgi:DNA repair exonuclease SbcCD nuclease subunit
METTASQAIRAILLSSAQRFAKWSKPGVLLAHLEVGAALTDSGQPLVGKADIELAEGDLLDSGADYIALGHIHKHQVLCDRVCYAGASRQCTFGEDPVKGYCLTAVERGEPPKIEHRRAPGRDLVTVEGAWDGEAVSFDTRPSEVPMNAIVRVRFETPEDAMQAASQSVDSYVRALDGQTVRIVPKVIPTSRVRSAEIHKARTNAERVEALWKVRDQRPERAGQILTKLGQLDSEVPA